MPSDNEKALAQVSDFELRLLKVFRVVVECGGFAAAETELGIGRSTISVHISNLESRLNLKLCRRGRAGFSLTEEGAEVYELMKGLFSSMEVFRSGINLLHAELSGELKVIASDTICLQAQSRIPDIIGQFAKVAPEVKVLLDVRGMTAIEKMVLNSEVDVGFVHLNQQYEGLDYNVLYDNRCHLYCSDAHPLFNVSNISLAEDSAHQKLVHSGIQIRSEISGVLADMNKSAVSYFYEARLAMIFSGAYIGFMPDFYVKEYVESGRLKALLPEEKYYDLGVAAISRSHGKSNRARDVFMDIVREYHEVDD